VRRGRKAQDSLSGKIQTPALRPRRVIIPSPCFILWGWLERGVEFLIGGREKGSIAHKKIQPVFLNPPRKNRKGEVRELSRARPILNYPGEGASKGLKVASSREPLLVMGASVLGHWVTKNDDVSGRLEENASLCLFHIDTRIRGQEEDSGGNLTGNVTESFSQSENCNSISTSYMVRGAGN